MRRYLWLMQREKWSESWGRLHGLVLDLGCDFVRYINQTRCRLTGTYHDDVEVALLVITQKDEAKDETSAELTSPLQAGTTALANEETTPGLAQKQVVSVTWQPKPLMTLWMGL